MLFLFGDQRSVFFGRESGVTGVILVQYLYIYIYLEADWPQFWSQNMVFSYQNKGQMSSRYICCVLLSCVVGLSPAPYGAPWGPDNPCGARHAVVFSHHWHLNRLKRLVYSSTTWLGRSFCTNHSVYIYIYNIESSESSCLPYLSGYSTQR